MFSKSIKCIFQKLMNYTLAAQITGLLIEIPSRINHIFNILLSSCIYYINLPQNLALAGQLGDRLVDSQQLTEGCPAFSLSAVVKFYCLHCPIQYKVTHIYAAFPCFFSLIFCWFSNSNRLNNECKQGYTGRRQQK